MNIIGNKIDLYQVGLDFEIPSKKMMGNTHVIVEARNHLIKNLHAQNLTQETYFLKEDVCRAFFKIKIFNFTPTELA